MCVCTCCVHMKALEVLGVTGQDASMLWWLWSDFWGCTCIRMCFCVFCACMCVHAYQTHETVGAKRHYVVFFAKYSDPSGGFPWVQSEDNPGWEMEGIKRSQQLRLGVVMTVTAHTFMLRCTTISLAMHTFTTTYALRYSYTPHEWYPMGGIGTMCSIVLSHRHINRAFRLIWEWNTIFAPSVSKNSEQHQGTEIVFPFSGHYVICSHEKNRAST